MVKFEQESYETQLSPLKHPFHLGFKLNTNEVKGKVHEFNGSFICIVRIHNEPCLMP